MSNEERLLDILRGWVGYSETDGRYRHIIDIYNSDSPLPRGYRVKYSDEWCAVTVSAAVILSGLKEKIGKECSCEQFIRIFKEKKIWREDGREIPRKGDIILYNWNDKYQPNDGWADHIGVVEKVENRLITVLEGNCNGSVKRRKLYVGNGYIRGYARPDYDGNAGGQGSEKQHKIIFLDIDGIWGRATTRASQEYLGTYVDGIVSRQPPSNKKYLYRASTDSWRFTERYHGGSDMVKALQRLTGSARDGYFGRKSVLAFQKFLRNERLYFGQIDYSMGSLTVKAWQRYLNSRMV